MTVSNLSSELVERMAARIQLWWMTQKHEPLHQNDAADLARTAYEASGISSLLERNERLKPVVAFLLGEAALDGVWFNDLHHAQPGRYWWRKHLRAALETQDRGSASHDD